MSEACAVANNFEFRENKLNNKKIYIFIFLFINSPLKYNNAPQRGVRVTFAEPAFAALPTRIAAAKLARKLHQKGAVGDHPSNFCDKTNVRLKRGLEGSYSINSIISKMILSSGCVFL